MRLTPRTRVLGLRARPGRVGLAGLAAGLALVAVLVTARADRAGAATSPLHVSQSVASVQPVSGGRYRTDATPPPRRVGSADRAQLRSSIDLADLIDQVASAPAPASSEAVAGPAEVGSSQPLTAAARAPPAIALS